VEMQDNSNLFFC